MKSLIITFTLLFLIHSTYGQVGNSITRGKTTLKISSKEKAGVDGTLAKYCDNKGGNCETLLFVRNNSISLPFTTGPLMDILKTGSIKSYKGMNKVSNSKGKLIQYYMNIGKSQIILTKNRNHTFISIIEFDQNKNSSKTPTSIFRRKGSDSPYPCYSDCIANWQDCYVEVSLNIPAGPELDAQLFMCDGNFRLCCQIAALCDDPTDMPPKPTRVRSIMAIQNTPTNFQLSIGN
ncbi:MAG: hypothetical protein IPO86_12545 [Saprospiraceae bacterium]|nr:hypothetical protein [Saprospiraceae bacterium]MBK9728936.1 hypothetical protein [Saprospiraceae bacterium]